MKDAVSYRSLINKNYPVEAIQATPPAQVMQEIQKIPESQSLVQSAPNTELTSSYVGKFEGHRLSPHGLFQNAPNTVAPNANASQVAAIQQQRQQTTSPGAQHYHILMQKSQQDAVLALQQPYVVTVCRNQDKPLNISR